MAHAQDGFGGLTGGCACSAVRYRCDEKPIVQLICHCRDCQQASGSAFAAVLFVPSDRLVMLGAEPKFHLVRTASGRQLGRGFCAECGSPILLRWPGEGVVECLQAASLDDPAMFDPSCEVWVSRAAAWHPLHPTTEKFAEAPAIHAVRLPIAAYFAARDGADA